MESVCASAPIPGWFARSLPSLPQPSLFTSKRRLKRLSEGRYANRLDLLAAATGEERGAKAGPDLSLIWVELAKGFEQDRERLLGFDQLQSLHGASPCHLHFSTTSSERSLYGKGCTP